MNHYPDPIMHNYIYIISIMSRVLVTIYRQAEP